MKKRISLLIAMLLTAAMVLSGCQESTGLIDTDEIKITGYKNIEIEEIAKPEPITDDEVQSEIDYNLTSNQETIEISDRAVETGDIVDINFVGKMDGEAFDGGSADNYELEIGSNYFIAGFEDSIIGHNVGDTFDWEGKFPDDYGAEEYAGKDVVFTITVNSILQYVTPEFNDEFVQKVSSVSKTTDEYREEIRKQLEEDSLSEYNSEVEDAVWAVVVENTEVKKYDETRTQELVDQINQYYQEAATYYGMEFADLLTQWGMTQEQFDSESKSSAQEEQKNEMIITAISEAENLILSDDEYEVKIAEIALEYGYETTEDFTGAYPEEELRNVAQMEVVRAWLVEHCTMVKSTETTGDDTSSDEG
ncbi:MAG: trigger factor [Lachnospiraceae bacterium]|jgi:trigger factor|nr:trigger factor [Lachnospiraceae bacterium]